jgi:serine/threonine protein kinase
MAPDGVLQKVVASLKSVGEFDLSAISVTPSSSVYKAVERKLRRALIIKLMPLAPWGANRAQVSAMAGAERRIVKGFDFPNIPRMLTGGEVDDHLFWITEFVDGIPLNTTLEKGETLSALDLVDMARQLCASVESTSKSGIVHHRFHPHNLIVEWDGGVKILDWGVPHYADLGAKASVYTLQAAHYLAPEQLAGQVGDFRSNLFSVGVILYKLATGKLPSNGETVALLRAWMDVEVPKNPSQWNPKIPAGISAPIIKALSRNPNDRYKSASELIKDLENFKKYGVKEELPANFFASKTPAAAAPGFGGPQSSRLQPEVTMELGSAWTPSVTASKPRDVAVASIQDSMVAIAEKPAEPISMPAEVVPAKETVYSEPEAKPAAAAKPKISLPKTPLSKIKRPKVTMKDVNRVVNKIPPLTAAVVFATVVAVFLLWKFIVPDTIIKESPVTATPVQQQATPTPAIVAQPVPETPAPVAQEAPAEPEAVVRSFDKNGRRLGKKKTVNAPLAAAPVFGGLSVNSDPAGASFQVDGRSDNSFVTPFTIAQLAPGHHVVTFNKAGYQSQSLATEVVAGSRAVMMSHLAAQGGMLSIGSTPAGAAITIDGRDTGRVTPAQVILPRGQHTITLKLAGYLEATQTLNSMDGQSHSMSPEMIAMGRTIEIKTTKKGLFGLGGRGDKDMGKVNVRTNPNGAAVLVNGQLAPKSTPLEFSLNPGGYELTFQLRGYKPHKKVIVVEAGSKLNLNENLEAEQ